MVSGPTIAQENGSEAANEAKRQEGSWSAAVVDRGALGHRQVRMPLGRGLTRPGAAIHEPEWLASLQSSYALHNVVALRPELPFSIIRWDGERSLDWIDLGEPSQRLRPSHFEIYYCKESLREEHCLEALLEASQSQSLVRKQLFGFWD